MGENPPSGAILDYALKSAASSPLVLEILDVKGELVRRFVSDDKPQPPDLQRIPVTPDWVPMSVPPSAAAGAHRFVWDLHYALPKELASPTGGGFRGSFGPWAPPGRYTVRLTAGEKILTRTLAVAKDPRLSVTEADLARQFELARDVQTERVRVAVARSHADALRKQIAALRAQKTPAPAELEKLSQAIEQIAGPPVAAPGEEFFDTEEIASTTLRRLASSLASLQGAVESADAAPTPDALAGFTERRRVADEALARWQKLAVGELARVNTALKAAGRSPLKAQ